MDSVLFPIDLLSLSQSVSVTDNEQKSGSTQHSHYIWIHITMSHAISRHDCTVYCRGFLKCLNILAMACSHWWPILKLEI